MSVCIRVHLQGTDENTYFFGMNRLYTKTY